MRLYLDCEWSADDTGRQELLSMALVPESGPEFYEAITPTRPVNAWVAQHVMPVMNAQPVDRPEFQARLHEYLAQFGRVEVVADWPEDIAHFCGALIVAPGVRFDTPPLAMRVVRVDSMSAVPHNALEDARAIRAEIMRRAA